MNQGEEAERAGGRKADSARVLPVMSWDVPGCPGNDGGTLTTKDTP